MIAGSRPTSPGSPVGQRNEILTQQPSQTWASVLQSKKTLKSYDVEISKSDGECSVVIPEEVLQCATPIWEDFIVGKFLADAPHIAKIHVIVNKIWRQGQDAPKIDVYQVSPAVVKFKICNAQMRERVIRRGMWNIADVPMIVSKWDPITEAAQPEDCSLPLWIHLKKVPLNMFSWEALSFISSAVGPPVKLHPETEACQNSEVAKVFVLADVSKKLPEKIKFSKKGLDFMVEFSYPWLPPRCSVCDKWGHQAKVCKRERKMMARQEENEQDVSDMVIKGDQSSDTAPAVLPEKQLDISISTTSSDETMQEIDTDIEQQQSETDWSLVSPEKSGKHSVTPKVDDNPGIISPSKFAVLSTDVEEGEIPTEGQNAEVDNSDDTLLKENHNEEEKSNARQNAQKSKKKKQKETIFCNMVLFPYLSGN